MFLKKNNKKSEKKFNLFRKLVVRKVIKSFLSLLLVLLGGGLGVEVTYKKEGRRKKQTTAQELRFARLPPHYHGHEEPAQ